MAHLVQIAEIASENRDFRRVVHTGAKSQIVVMCLPPFAEIGLERYPDVEQSLFFQKGMAEVVLGERNFLVTQGDVVIIAPGVKHAVRNIGSEELKIISLYVPPTHLPGRIHKTKADAEADMENEAYGMDVQGKAL